jgi:3'(2'), 5'-bisphosphate nucleotidase
MAAEVVPVQVDLDSLVEIAIVAGAEIMTIYNRESGPCAGTKGDGSPVTDADQKAEAIILARLALIYPGIPVVAEEEAAAGQVPATAATFFLVDPLDGTKEFLNRNGEFTVNIAVVVDGVPVSGVVYAPALGELFAGDASGAYSYAVTEGIAGPKTALRVRRAPRKIVAIGSRSHGSDAVGDWLKRYEVGAFVSKGSSLKFCHVASGQADIYPRFGRTMEWDTAAGDAVLRAAGGCVLGADGSVLAYNKRNQAHDIDFANHFFIAYGDPALVQLPDSVLPARKACVTLAGDSVV